MDRKEEADIYPDYSIACSVLERAHAKALKREVDLKINCDGQSRSRKPVIEVVRQEIFEICAAVGITEDPRSTDDERQFAVHFHNYTDPKVLRARSLPPKPREPFLDPISQPRSENATKAWKRALIDQLARLFCEYAMPLDFEEYSHFALPHAANSHFVQFVVSILEHHTVATEIEPRSVSFLWATIKSEKPRRRYLDTFKK